MTRRLLSMAVMFALSAMLIGFLPQTDSTSRNKKAEPAKDTTWLPYVKPNEFSIQHPSNWKLHDGNKISGTSVVGFSKHHHDSCRNETCAMCPNSAGVSLSIYPKDSRSLQEIAEGSVKHEVWEFRMDSMSLNDQLTIRIHSIEDGYPVIKTFYEYPDIHYACLYGKYNSGKDSAQMASDLERIQNSFKILKPRKSEPTLDTTWLTYLEPGEYSFQYPKDWELQIRWKQQIRGLDKNYGHEILSLYKHSPTSQKKGGCGLDENTAKLSLSIFPMDSNSIEEIAHKPDREAYNHKRYKDETLRIGEKKAVRIYSLYDGYEIIVRALFEYKDGKYVSILGMFGNGSDSTQIANNIKRIQDSFRILK